MNGFKWMMTAALAVIAPVMTSEAVPNRVTNGLVGEWKSITKMPLGLPERAYDTSGLNQTASVVGSSTQSWGWWDGGMNLAGDKYLHVANSPNLNFGTGSFTLTAWIRMSDTSRYNKTIIDNRGTDGRGYSFAVTEGNKLLLQMADETGWLNFTSEPYLAPNRWHHVAVSVSRTSWPVHISFYIDGYDAGLATPKMGNINNTNNPFYIGGHKDTAGYRFSDRLDEVFVFNRALPNYEIWNVLNPGRPSFTPSYWNDNSRQGQNNCYNYANNKATNTFAQPGRASGSQATYMDCSVVRQAAINDGLEPISSYPSTLLNFKTGAALVVAPGYDYHWYRLDESGTWTHKPGGTRATNLDNAGQVITDPRTANRGPYTQFCGFFMLWSDIAEGYGHESIN